MCGINGIITRGAETEQSISQLLTIMNQKIFHRGPDQDGFFIEKINDSIIGMAMRRLSIIDLSTGKQPIFAAYEQKVIVFNGEIYNFKQLKSEYLSAYNFRTNSDTEVILALYDKLGVEAFGLLDGMFAFSIYDKNLNKVFIARDFFGEKPLYYTKQDNHFYWCSELKSLTEVLPSTPKISKQGLNLFFQMHYIPAPFTIYENVLKLEANHYIEFDVANFYFSIREIKQKKITSYSNLSKIEATKINEELVRKSVESRSVSDVPIGTFLSGGVDSSIVSLCLAQQSENKIETFSIGFDKKAFDETDKSQTVAKLINSNHHEFILTQNDLKDSIDKILLNFDEPYADSSMLPTYLVASKTKDFVTVALTGDGGDEVYGGYNKYYISKLNTNYTKIIPQKIHDLTKGVLSDFLNSKDDNRGFLFKAKRFLKAVDYEGNSYYDIISLAFLENERKEIIKSASFEADVLHYYKNIIGSNNKTLTDFRNIDRLLSLEGDLLVKVDRTAMLTSLECRAPFLNKELWGFTSQLPEKYLINGWDKKHLLKESFKHYFPKNFLNKSKQGFGVPVGDWLRGSLKEELLHYVDRKFIDEQGIFNYNEIYKIVQNHIDGKVDNTIRVFTYFCFQKWYKNNF
ncbi:asparagine synthase (glutamine-hydrolyzing) [Flavobacterium columnare]|uniref:asparagine synthase (glutamine-hydrolyzing) n=1 Tax=Flavobacterium columnare TaxID=996 RepID=UPI000D1A36CA|nr:asparagine synthase (glutamine-hydrolyzing) [Flavobacterium columnare]MBF6652509.1 asparagine synthase (glutamine-hydrolyzing) [Flavobacterium columnare]MBF6655523.1 asparagine synthase (glutamine-hydrolyzing) [Flavobacterium columnare]MBF6658378.1 asparagine synthase (glutamine-hydrolyzing) [Flavobacterium columnare]PTD14818.1 asparagine synthase (glutamine-hydrolyzing) [Flavobacterium columnare]